MPIINPSLLINPSKADSVLLSWDVFMAETTAANPGGGDNTSTWFAANTAIFVPCIVQRTFTAVKMAWMNGAAVSGNVDVGIYDSAGNRKVNMGSTAQAGTSAIQIVDITDTTLTPGLYYLAMVLDNTTGTVDRANLGTTSMCRSCGVVQQATAFPLPSSATFATFTGTVVPAITATSKTTI